MECNTYLSKRIKHMEPIEASVTVEASLVVPIFIFSILTLIYFNYMLNCNEKVNWALLQTGREISMEYSLTERKELLNPVCWNALLLKNMQDNSVIPVTLKSSYEEKGEYINLRADYLMKIPFPLYNLRVCYFSHGMKTRPFIGVKTRADNKENLDEIVYITKTGTVFHRKLSCTYLTPSITEILYSDLDFVRSVGGAKYYPCEVCCKNKNPKANDRIFICNYGDRYHTNRGCSKISRSIEKVKLRDVGGRVPCSKCGGDK